MPLTRQETSYYVTRLYKFLREGHQISFNKQRGYDGEIIFCTEDSSHILLDYRKCVITTLIHEFIHHIYPEWSETRVLKLESRIINSLTERQVKNLIKRLAEAI